MEDIIEESKITDNDDYKKDNISIEITSKKNINHIYIYH